MPVPIAFGAIAGAATGGPGVEVEHLDVRFDGGVGRRGGELQQIMPARFERRAAHPEYARGNPVGRRRGFVQSDDHVAARGVDLIGEGQRDGAAGGGAGKIAVEGGDAGDVGDAAGRENFHRHPGTRFAARDHAAIAAKIRVRPADPLDRHAEAAVVAAPRRVHLFEMFE